MKKNAIRWIAVFKLFVVLLYPFVALATPAPVQAAYTNCSDVSKGSIRILQGKLGDAATFQEGQISELKLTLGVSSLETGTYKAWIYDSNDMFADLVDGMSDWVAAGESNEFTVDQNTQSVELTLTGNSSAFNIKSYFEYLNKDYKYVYLFKKGSLTGIYTTPAYCQLGYYLITNNGPTCSEAVKVTQEKKLASGSTKQCVLNNNASCADTSSIIRFEVSGLKDSSGNPYSGLVFINGIAPRALSESTVSPGVWKYEVSSLQAGNYDVKLGNTINTIFKGNCTAKFKVEGRCSESDSCSSTMPSSDPSGEERVFELCSQVSDSVSNGKCTQCLNKNGVWTAVGCIDRSPKSIVRTFLEIGLGIGGGITLLMVLAGGFMITTSQGDPKQVNEAREMITSAIIGLLFIIFSVFILQFIGVTIFNIPGFGVNPNP